MITMVTRVLLVRHGQSEWNLSGRWQGQADPPLTDVGRAQARAGAQNLGQVDAIWSSDLQRATETANIIAAELGVGPVVVDADLRERDVGDWAGLTREEIDQRYPGYLTPPDGVSAAGWAPPRPPGWEPDDVLVARTIGVLLRIRHEVRSGDVLIVGHAGMLYSVERALGADGSRLGNLEGRWLELASRDDGQGNRQAAPQLADIARLGDRLALLPPDQVTMPNQI
jgi:probable phosphoglycerate mutase